MQRHGGVEIGLGGPHFDGDGGDLDHLGGALADDMAADDAIRQPVDHEFDQHGGVAAGQGRLERLEHRPVDIGLREPRARLRLGEADGADLRIGEHRGRHIGVVDRCRLAAEHRVGEGGALANGDRRKIDAVGHVADARRYWATLVREYSSTARPPFLAISTPASFSPISATFGAGRWRT